ncbi:MAG: hypothetical protein ABIS23_01950 [Sphingomicrobium sp.]
MIVLLGASSIFLTALQASINAPTNAFRGCLKEATTKASSEKVAPDGIEDFLKAQCSAQMESLKGAVVAFRVKNGMARKTAVADANMTVEDYMAAPVDRYRFMAELNAPPKTQAAPAAAPAAAAAAPTQPTQPRP